MEPHSPPAARRAALRRSLLAFALLSALLALVGIVGSFYSPVYPVLMGMTLLSSCLVQLVRLLGEVGADLPLIGWAFQNTGGRYHAVRAEHGTQEEADAAEAYELQRQILSLSSAAAGSPTRAAAFARILQALSSARDFSPEDFQSLQELDGLWGSPGSAAPRSAPLTPAQIQALPTWKYAASPRAQAAQGATASPPPGAAAPPQHPTCSICLEPFALGDQLRILPCAHNYHARCVDEWLAVSGVCPECRSSCVEAVGEDFGGGGGAGAALADPWAPRGSALV